MYRFERGDVNCGRDDVVGGLADVHVVVGVDGRTRTFGSVQVLDGPVGDDLVGVHVSGCAGTRLEYVHDELVIEVAIGDLARGGDYRLGYIAGEKAKFVVDLRRGELDGGYRVYEGTPESEVADGEVEDGAHGVRAVVGIHRDVELAHGVALQPKFL